MNRITAICKNIDGTPKHNVKQKKQDTKEYTQCDSIHTKLKNR